MKMENVTEYAEEYQVELVFTDGIYNTELPTASQKGYGRFVVKALNEGRCNCTEVDRIELLTWVKMNKPEIWDDII